MGRYLAKDEQGEWDWQEIDLPQVWVEKIRKMVEAQQKANKYRAEVEEWLESNGFTGESYVLLEDQIIDTMNYSGDYVCLLKYIIEEKRR